MSGVPSKKRKRSTPPTGAAITERSFVDLASSFDSDGDMDIQELPDLDESWRMDGLRENGRNRKKKRPKENPTKSSLQQKQVPAKVKKVTTTAMKATTVTKKQKPEGKTTKNNGRKKGTSNDQLVSSALECIICMDFAVSPIHNCSNGHITCGTCVSRLTNKNCAMCKAKLGISVLGERLAKQLELKLPCDFSEDGCKELVKSTDVKKHKLSCYYRNVECHFEMGLALICKDKVPIQKYVGHLHAHHGCPEITPHIPGSNKFKLPFTIANSPSKFPTAFVITFKDKSFILQFYRTKTNFVVWIAFLGSKTEAEKYRYKMTAIPTNLALKKVFLAWSLPILPFHGDFGFKKPSPFSATIPISTLMTFFSSTPTDELRFEFDMEIQSC